MCQAVSVPVGETGLALQTSTRSPACLVIAAGSCTIVTECQSLAANPVLWAAEPLPPGLRSPPPQSPPVSSCCSRRMREQASGARVSQQVSLLRAHNKMPPIVSTEGVTSERLLSTLDCLIVVIAAQETMFVFLRPLSTPRNPTPREKPSAK